MSVKMTLRDAAAFALAKAEGFIKSDYEGTSHFKSLWASLAPARQAIAEADRNKTWVVSQQPKGRHRAGLHTVVMVVQAPTKAEAVRKAIDKGKIGLESWFGPSPEYSQPTAVLLEYDTVLRY